MTIYSPIHTVNFRLLNAISVKRDDLIDPYISGNKWRKLKYILKDVEAKKKTHLITFGGAYSNHLVATAAAASRNNLKSTAFVRGEIVTNEMLLLCKLFGMDLIFTDRESYKNKPLLFSSHFGNNSQTYFIDEGGASEEAVIGCAEVIDELTESYDHIFCAAGTGTTASGLLKGINNHKLQTKLHVIPVLKGGSFIENEIQQYEADLSNLQIHTGYHFGGYAKTTPVLIQFIKDFTGETGMLIDPVYTAKMFYAINDLVSKNYFKKEDKILAIHTGGLLGILGMKEKLGGNLNRD
ncbi:1-aminocyclopropane-1-carboxylate deaminase/D-cysteine desulfhydrase [Pedobacter polaris]|uniref:1-aminocyclopropane-1-carboxylate deaminase/D-cysteine desulfhydrase n=1 Tax=Pedobacter polaris TaxID=2571273 RepID=A0A4U1CHF6_9SPHI|nr:pyridoxal-phosphate dependent enzyme [Pedobacter polaris]TKC04629.1 1-aminocyclopropane-1-carboxylate deaminase/D-cysteine desulfhydrase [Pedobacter polaris]